MATYWVFGASESGLFTLWCVCAWEMLLTTWSADLSLSQGPFTLCRPKPPSLVTSWEDSSLLPFISRSLTKCSTSGGSMYPQLSCHWHPLTPQQSILILQLLFSNCVKTIGRWVPWATINLSRPPSKCTCSWSLALWQWSLLSAQSSSLHWREL